MTAKIPTAKRPTPAIDQRHMKAALGLARRGLGDVWPNPAVGCVLVRPDLGGRIVGRGWTQPGGRPHAETEALPRAGTLARGATAYVSLEPCSHTGETDPCASALIDAGVSRVVVAVTDPDARVSGKGLAMLRKAGLEVETGICAAEAQVVNEGFFNRIQKNRPLVSLKLATTLDGCIATHTGESQWITGPAARQRGHLLRARHDAIITGIGTVLADDPAMTCRLPGLASRSPIRTVLDSRARLTSQSQLAATAGDPPTWQYTCIGAPTENLGTTAIERCEVSADQNNQVDINAVLTDLADRGITRALVEAGPGLSAGFLKSGTVDTLYWFRAPGVMGADGKSAAADIGVSDLADVAHFALVATMPVGEDRLEIYSRRAAA